MGTEEYLLDRFKKKVFKLESEKVKLEKVMML
jgi:hypothetical protein